MLGGSDSAAEPQAKIPPPHAPPAPSDLIFGAVSFERGTPAGPYSLRFLGLFLLSEVPLWAYAWEHGTTLGVASVCDLESLMHGTGAPRP